MVVTRAVFLGNVIDFNMTWFL